MDYEKKWLAAAKEAMAHPEVQGFLGPFLQEIERIGAPMPLEMMVKQANQAAKEYAGNWADLSKRHREGGVYRTVADLIGKRDGLLIDVGCGNGNLIATLDRDKVLGFDNNLYALELAEENLRNRGLKVSRYGKATIGFDSHVGFFLDPLPIKEDVDLDGITLICDDMGRCTNTKSILASNQEKAKTVVISLTGGQNVWEPLHFITAIKKKVGAYNPNNLAGFDHIMPNLSSICYPDAKIYLTTRITADTKDFHNPSLHAQATKVYHERYSQFIKIKSSSITPMLNEKQARDQTHVDVWAQRTDSLKPLTSEEQERIFATSEYYLLVMEAELTPRTDPFLMDMAQLPQVMQKKSTPKKPKQKRNEPCACGSGKKFKKCCGI